MPGRGNYLIVVESQNEAGEATYQDYDPRHAPLLSETTPQKAYRSINWDTMKRVFAYHFGNWEKMNVILGYVSIFLFILAAMLIDNLGKHVH